MTDPSDFSRLPEDPAYWENLEARIVAAAVPARDGGSAWWNPLAARAWPLGALAAAASVAALLLVPARPDGAAPDSIRLLGVSTEDPVLVRFVDSPAPPQLASLLVPPRPADNDD